MADEGKRHAPSSGRGFSIGELIGTRSIVMLVSGILLGSGVVLLSGGDPVVLPAVGPLSSQFVGLIGIGIAGILYRQWGCGEGGGCGCSGSCGDSCSYDP